MPGWIAGITYSPDSLVWSSRTALVPWLVSVIVTPGIGAPLGSVTTPLISPEGVCALASVMKPTHRIQIVARNLGNM